MKLICTPFYNINRMLFNKIIAIGDIHGDYQSLIRVLIMCKLINNKLEWTGGSTYVIQMGDTLDGKRPDTKIEDSLEALINDETQTILKEDIENLLTSDLLTERQSQYIRMYFFKEMTLEQIGKEFSITREAVRQGLNKAYATLRNIIEND